MPANILKGVSITDYEFDPYCSRECCEKVYGTTSPTLNAYHRDYAGPKEEAENV